MTERDLTKKNLESIMEKQFSFKYPLKSYNSEDLEGWTLYALIKVGQKELAHNFYGVDPESLIYTGKAILEGKQIPEFFQKRARHILELDHTPEGKVRVRAQNDSVVVERDAAAFEFFNYHNDLFNDAISKDSERVILQIASSQTEMQNNPRIYELFQRNNKKLVKVPDKYSSPL